MAAEAELFRSSAGRVGALLSFMLDRDPHPTPSFAPTLVVHHAAAPTEQTTGQTKRPDAAYKPAAPPRRTGSPDFVRLPQPPPQRPSTSRTLRYVPQAPPAAPQQQQQQQRYRSESADDTSSLDEQDGALAAWDNRNHKPAVGGASASSVPRASWNGWASATSNNMAAVERFAAPPPPRFVVPTTRQGAFFSVPMSDAEVLAKQKRLWAIFHPHRVAPSVVHSDGRGPPRQPGETAHELYGPLPKQFLRRRIDSFRPLPPHVSRSSRTAISTTPRAQWRSNVVISHSDSVYKPPEEAVNPFHVRPAVPRRRRKKLQPHPEPVTTGYRPPSRSAGSLSFAFSKQRRVPPARAEPWAATTALAASPRRPSDTDPVRPPSRTAAVTMSQLNGEHDEGDDTDGDDGVAIANDEELSSTSGSSNNGEHGVGGENRCGAPIGSSRQRLSGDEPQLAHHLQPHPPRPTSALAPATRPHSGVTRPNPPYGSEGMDNADKAGPLAGEGASVSGRGAAAQRVKGGRPMSARAAVDPTPAARPFSAAAFRQQREFGAV